MIHSSTQSRQAGAMQSQTQAPPHPQAHAQASPGKPGARVTAKAGGKPAPERKGETSSGSTPTAPATRLQQRSLAVPTAKGRPGPAAEFLNRMAQDPPSLHSILSVRLDDATRTAIIALDSGLYFKDRLASGHGTLTRALMEELSDFARKMTLEGPDVTAGLVYSTFLDNADATTLTADLVAPVFQSLLRGPPYLAPERLAVAVKSICALFPDCVLPDNWLRGLMQAARESLAPGHAQGIADVTTAILLAASAVLPRDDLRAALDRTVLRVALQACADDPERPIGLVAWMNGAATQTQPLGVATRVLDGLRDLPDLGPHALAAVMVTISAGTLMPRASDGSAPAAPLGLVLPWVLQLPDSHRPQALAGLAQGMTQAGPLAQPSHAHLRTVLRVIGELEDRIHATASQGWVGMMLGHVIVAPLDDEADGRRKKAEGPETGAAADSKADSKTALRSQDGKDTWIAARDAPSEACPTQVLAGLRAVLVGAQRRAPALEHRLPMLGQALAHMAGGRDIPAPTMRALVAGLADSPIPVRDAAQVLAGLATGAGGPGMKDEVFAAFVAPLGRADTLRGAVLACHLCGAVGAAGVEGRKRDVPIGWRMAQALEALPDEASLPRPLALGCQLADAPLEAVRTSQLPRADQLLLLEWALEMPGGVGEAVLAEQVFDCALLAAEDADFAFEAALRLCEPLDTASAEPLVRQLRAALLPHVVASTGSPGGTTLLAARLDSLARFYDRASRSLWIAHAQVELELEMDGFARERKGHLPWAARPAGPGPFLASEAALMRSGPHAALLEPLAAKLETLGVTLGAITVSSSLSAIAGSQGGASGC